MNINEFFALNEKTPAKLEKIAQLLDVSQDDLKEALDPHAKGIQIAPKKPVAETKPQAVKKKKSGKDYTSGHPNTFLYF